MALVYRIFVVSLNTIRELRQHRLLVVALLLLILVFFAAFRRASEYKTALHEKDAAVVSRLRAELIIDPLDGFTFLACGIGLVFGSTVVSNELRSRVVHAILARPITRTQFVIGKVAGALTVALAFNATAVVLGALLVNLLAVSVGAVFWIGLCQSFVLVFFLTVVSASLSLFVKPAFAGAMAAFLILLPDCVQPLLDHWSTPLRWLAGVLYYITPAVIPGDPLRDGLDLNPTASMLGTYVVALVTNVLYAICSFLVGLIYLQARKDVIGE